MMFAPDFLHNPLKGNLCNKKNFIFIERVIFNFGDFLIFGVVFIFWVMLILVDIFILRVFLIF